VNAYIVYECKKCRFPFIVPEDGIRKAEILGLYIDCPLCHGGVSKVGAYEDLRECMEKVNTYERVNGRVRQTRYK
jgi:hypothetical protein